MRRRRALAHTLALACLVGVAAPAGAEAAPPRCEAKAGETIARTSAVRVFQRVRGTVDDGQTVDLYACRSRSRRTVRVERFRNTLDGTLTLDEALLGGSRWLVLALDEATGTSQSFDLFAYDLTTGRRTFTFSRDGSREGAQVAVTRSGGIGVLDGGAVRAFAAAGARVLAASGASALAAGENTLYWTQGGTAASAALSGHPTSG